MEAWDVDGIESMHSYDTIRSVLSEGVDYAGSLVKGKGKVFGVGIFMLNESRKEKIHH